MTQENYNRAGLILEQIKKAEKLKDRIKIDYENSKEDVHLKETLSKCIEAISILIEIDINKFKEL